MENFKNKKTRIKGCGAYKIIFLGSTMNEYNEDGFHGISHLMEHCMCERVKSIDNEMKINGVSWNAYTSDTRVVFIMIGLIKGIKKMIPKFTDAILNYKIEESVFERERKVVITEYEQAYSNQWGEFSLNFNRRHYDYCEPIGFKKDLENITYEKFIDFKNKYFSKPSFIGMTSPNKNDELNLEKFNKIYEKKINFNNEEELLSLKFGNYDTFPMEHYSSCDAQRIILMNSEFELDDDAMNYTFAKLFKNIMAGGLTTPLYKELREKLGYVYSIYSSVDRMGKDKFVLQFFVQTQTDHVETVKKKMKKIFDNVRKYIKKRNFQIELKKERNGIKLKEYTVYDDSFDDLNNIVNDNIMSKDMTFEKFISFIDLFEKNDRFYCQDDEFI